MRVSFLLSAIVVAGLGLAAPAASKVEGNTIVLGAAVSLTGKYSIDGQHTKNGYELAVKRVNEQGGVKVGGKAYKVEIRYYDDESSNERAASLVERLIAQDGIKFILGPYSSPLTGAIVPVTEKYKIPMVEANGASRSLFTKGYRYLFAVLSTSDQYLSSAVDLAAEKAREAGRDPSSLRLALAMGDDSFSLDVRAGIIDAAKRYGMTVVIDDKVPDNFTDVSATLARVKAVKPDVLLVSGHAMGAATATRQIADAKVDVPVLAMTHCDSAQIAEKFGSAAEYTLCASQWAPTLAYSDKWFGSAGDYNTLFQKTYGYEAPYQAAESSAAVLVFVDAIQRANGFETEKVRDALARTDVQTFYGPIKFDETGKNVVKPMMLYQVQDGDYKVVAPTKWATAKLIYPRPAWSKRGS
ncbi:MAG: amino acid ABC transporter substrate-binding protein [Alphaproteobacteria bacterium]